MILYLDTGIDELVFLALRGGSGGYAERCLLLPATADLIEGLTQILRLWPEELERISHHTSSPKTSLPPDIERLAHELWTSLPLRLREMIVTSTTILFSPGSFGALGEFPLEVLNTDAGWLGLTHQIVRVPTTRALAQVTVPQPATYCHRGPRLHLSG